MNMTLRFKLVFWGVLFAFLSIQIDHFDVLPDVIGYVLLVIGCGGLSSRFTMAQVFWAILAMLAVVPGWFIGGHSGEFGILVEAMQCGGLWFLLGGMIALAATGQRPDLVKRLSNRRLAYVGLAVFLAVFDPLRSNTLYDVAGIAGLVAGMGMLLTILMILHEIWRFQRGFVVVIPDDFSRGRHNFPLGLLTILVAGGLGMFFVSQHSGYQSTTFSGANFHAQDPQGCEVVNADLRKLLDAKGFSANYNPTAMDRFAGMHSEESQDIWLKSGRDEFKGIYLRITKSPASIFIDTKWEHDGFRKDALRTKRHAYEVALEIARWFHNRPEKEMLSPDIDGAGIKYFEESLAELPVN
jgi:hypothetical protein